MTVKPPQEEVQSQQPGVPDPLRGTPVFVPGRPPPGARLRPPRMITSDEEAKQLVEQIRRSGANRSTEPPPAPAALKDRVIVLGTAQHLSADGQTSVSESRFVYEQESDEQPCTRKARAGPEWRPLDAGWLKEAGAVILINEEGKFPHVNPTPEERAEAAAKVVELGCLPPLPPGAPAEHQSAAGERPVAFAEIAPGRSAQFAPADLARLRVRCRKGEARYTCAAYPK